MQNYNKETRGKKLKKVIFFGAFLPILSNYCSFLAVFWPFLVKNDAYITSKTLLYPLEGENFRSP